MTISAIERAIIELLAGADRSRIASDDVPSPPLSMSIDNSGSSVVLAAIPTHRTVLIGNLGVATAFLSMGSDAVADAGIPLFGSVVLPSFELPPGQSLNGITGTGPATLAFQTFGPE